MAVLTNTMMQGTAAISDEESYQIQKSLRFDAADTTYLSRSLSAKGNRKTWTYATWYKNSKISDEHLILNVDNGSSTNDWLALRIEDDNKLTLINNVSGSITAQLKTNRVFADPGAWMHIVVAVDTTQATDTERIKIYINGEQETSFATSTYPSQNAELQVNNPSYNHNIGFEDARNDYYFSGYLADTQFIDGLSLSPAAFGSFDSAGVFNPKTLARPAPNTNKTWSGMVTTDTGSFRGGHPATALFDGALSPTCQSSSDSNGNWIKFTPTGGIPFSDLQVKQNGSTEVEYVVVLDDDTEYSERHASNGWHQVASGVSGTLKSLQVIMRGAAEYSETSAIKIDNIMLVDGQTDPTTISKLNDGRKWSDGVTLPGSGVTGAAANLFDGSLSSWVQTSNSSDWIEIDLGSVAFINSFELYGSSSYDQDYKFYHGGGTLTWSGHFGGNAWKDFASSLTSPVTKVEYKDSGGSGTPSIAAIRVDGEILVDGEIDNSFHLKFNDTADDYSIGLDSLGEDYSKDDVTTGGPMRKCTTASGAIADTGFRTDPYKNNIVLAIPGDAYEDVSHTIKGSGSAKTVNRSGHHELNDNQYKFYGMSKYDNGWGTCYAEHADIAVDEGEDFTLEFWAYVPTPVTTHMRLFNWGTEANESNGARCSLYTGTGATDGTINCYFLGTGIGNGTVDTSWQNAWTHWALTRKSGTVRFFMNGSPVGDAAVTVNGAVSADELYLGAQNGSSKTQQWTGDFKFYAGVCKYDKPFKPLNRNDFYPNNINASEIDTTIASSKFANIKYTGNGGTQTVVTGSFQPDFVWIKDRNSNSHSNKIWDVVNGVEKYLETDTDDALTTESNGVTAFTSTGFTTGNYSSTNTSGSDYMATCFKAGGTASSNTNGSITSSVSASDIFSIVKYTGTGANATVGHGLPVAPHMIWFKNMDSGSHSWGVYHKELTGPNGDATKKITLDQDNTKRSSNSSDFFNDTHPTSTVFSIGSDPNYNTSGANMVAYCWAPKKGAAAFGWYTGNGSTTAGPFNRTTFKPELVIVRCISSNEQWWRYSQAQENDSDNTNLNDPLSITNAGYVVNDDSADLDIYHDGWRPQHSGNSINGNSQDYIWAAWGDGKGVGSDLDSLSDSPTNYKDTDGNVHGNFCSLNPLQNGGLTLSQGNLQQTLSSGSTWKTAGGTVGVSSGKWYFEYEVLAGPSSPDDHIIGWAKEDFTTLSGNLWTDTAHSYSSNGWYRYNTGSNIVSLNSYTVGDVIGIAINFDNGNLYFYKNGTAENSGNAVNTTSITGVHYPIVANWSSGTTCTGSLNFGQRSFKYTPPSGYKALCTQNLDDFDTDNNPSKYFDVLTWTGDGSASRAITGLGFQPDLSWIKRRNTSLDHFLWDAVRGVTKEIYSNQGYAEGTATNKLASFDSGGITVKDNSAVNADGDTYVGWFWDAGTAANSSVDSCSQTVNGQWTNPTAGFSITSWEGGGGAGQTVAHGLGAKPDFFMTKRVDGSQNWLCYHSALGAEYMLTLDATDAKEDTTNAFNDTEPTNTLITYGSESRVGNSDTHVTYAWTEISQFSKFGHYVGTGSSTNFIHLGFKPKWFILKPDADNSWRIFDYKRTAYSSSGGYFNPLDRQLQAQGDNAENSSSTYNIHFLSNGIQLQASLNAGINGSGTNFYYAAFAEHPFKTTRAE